MKNKYLDIIFTNHAINRLHNRDISQSDAWEVFKHPDRIIDGKIVGSKKFYKNLNGKKIEVVAQPNEKGEWVVFSCWSKEKTYREKSSYKDSVNEHYNFLERFISNLLDKILFRKKEISKLRQRKPLAKFFVKTKQGGRG